MAGIRINSVVGFCVVALFTRFAGAASDSPLSPAAALASFRLEPGLHIELVAAEPTVVAPVAMAFDETGRLFVVENRGYPTGPGSNQPPVGTIALLEDIDGDGRFEKRTVFADGLTFPNGVMPWGGGAIITCAPDVLWLSDTNGDGRCDVREVWLTGFDDKNTTQLRVSHPTLGPDGWIYLTSGYTGESPIRSPRFPDRPPLKLRTDARFHPFTGEFEAVDGRAQFGQTFDDFGNRFICYNRVHVQHVVGSSRHWKRNPDLNFSATVQNCPEVMINDLLSDTENLAARIYPISDNLTTADSHAGTFSAACGVHVYRGDALTNYYGRVFVCDPTANLVHWDELVPNGATFIARRLANQTEFLASSDNWFRPVNLAVGPDGALYICDMYRKTIEHPQYLPEEVRKRTDFTSGRNMGRIWRVRTAGSKFNVQRSTFSVQRSKPAGKSSTQWVRELESTNGWTRDTAFRLLLERRDTNMLKPLAALVNKGHSAPARAAALHLLGAMEELEYGTFSLALRDAHAGVREAAARQAEEFVRLFWREPRYADNQASLFMLLNAAASDADAHVRFACALALGAIPDGRAMSLDQIARRDGHERWMRAAVLSGLHQRAGEFLERLLTQSSALAPELMRDLGRMIGAAEPLRVTNALHQLVRARAPAHEAWQIAGLAGLLEGIGSRTDVQTVLTNLIEPSTGSAVRKTSREQFQRLLARAEASLGAADQPLATRLAAVSLLANAEPDRAARLLPSVLKPSEPPGLQQEAIKELCRLPGPDSVTALLASANWTRFTAAVRQNVLAGILAQRRHITMLLEALEQERLPLAAVPAAQRNQLLKHKDEAVRQRAEKLFKAAGGDRMKVFEDFKSILTLKANPANGRALFKTHCATCHRLDREGVAVGPDLLGIRNQPKEAILLHVLVPNYEIMPGFAGYQIETADGRELSGLILSETAASITLRQAQGLEETIPRTRISSLTASQLSLMPEGVEQSMTRQGLADLIAYLKGEGD